VQTHNGCTDTLLSPPLGIPTIIMAQPQQQEHHHPEQDPIYHRHLGSLPPSGPFQPPEHQQQPPLLPPQPALVVFSGGTAFNSVAGELQQLTTRVAHVMPVSDDGGSTAEIVRVLGGPAVGDIRSRCIRLADSSDEEAEAVKTLLAHRLSSDDPQAAMHEWYSILDGQHTLWDGVSEPYKQVIRSLLIHFEKKRKKIGNKNSKRKGGHTNSSTLDGFNFQNGSIGNFFFAGSRTFFGSLEAAIFQFSRVARIPEGSLVVPAIRTEERIRLGAELEDGTIIKGQNQISHPSVVGSNTVVKGQESHPPLPSPLRRVFYLSSGGGQSHEREVLPRANPRAVSELEKADAIIYGMGSLYTSICPIVCLEGMGEAIASRPVPKVLLLNGSQDRETSRAGTHKGPMTASDVVQAVCDASNRKNSRRGLRRLSHPPSAYVTGLLVPRSGEIHVDLEALYAMGVRHVVEVPSIRSDCGSVLFHPTSLVTSIHTILELLLSSSHAGNGTHEQTGAHMQQQHTGVLVQK